MVRVLFLLVCCITVGFGQSKVGVRVLLGVNGTESTRWDGSVRATGAQIVKVEPWRFDQGDTLDGTRWKAATHPPRLFGAQQQAAARNFVANGVMVWLDNAGENVQLNVDTAQGNFTFRLGDIPYGTAKKMLDGRAMVDRIPAYDRITNDGDEQDFPVTAASKDGSLWLAYMEFKHHPEHKRLRVPLTQDLANFDSMLAPVGGDRILARKFSNGAWGEPVALTPGGGDLYRPAIAVNGSGKVWVFWSSNENGDFDLYARSMVNGAPVTTVRITNAAGSDVFPAATTDSTGKVWVAWQAWRNGKATILTASEQGDTFTQPVTVSNSAGNEWNPSIAADKTGRVTIAYDSYRNGNYDIFGRTMSSGAWQKEFLIAGAETYEAYPSIAYDPQGRLWAAYEEGAARWGKDFGAHNTSGVAIYQGRAVRLRGFEKDGRAVSLNETPDSVLPGQANLRVDDPARQSGASNFLIPESERAKSRRPSQPSQNFFAPKNTSPNLHIDASGRMWLAVRSPHPIWWNQIGTSWSEYVVSYDGAKWTGPVFLAHTDNLLDNRPALASLAGGELLVTGSSDSRMRFDLLRISPQRPPVVALADDPYQNDLFLNTLSLGAAPAPIQVKDAPAPVLAAQTAADKRELSMVTTMRGAKMNTQLGPLHVVRGEFHRHSEVSADGGNDGTVIDQYRYMIDAARMEWVGCCDHDNGGGREYTWWLAQKLTDIFHTPGKFIPMFSYERSVPYPEGHRNVVFAKRGIRTLPRLPITKEDQVAKAPDTQMLYRYLRHFNGIVASHTSGTNMGTDWRDNDPVTEPVVEIYQGERQNYELPDGPRTNSADDSIGGWRPKGFVNLALEAGFKLAFQASSDHISTHQSYCNILAKDFTRQGVLEAFQKRHVYGATENILAEFRSGQHIMGDAFTADKAPEFTIKLQGTAPFAKVVIVKDNKYVYTASPKSAKVDFKWRDSESAAGKSSYYYVRGEQDDGEVVWVSPMWVTRK